MRVWRLQRATAMEHRIAGQRVRQVKNRSATELYYSGRFEEHYLQRVKSGSRCDRFVARNFTINWNADGYHIAAMPA